MGLKAVSSNGGGGGGSGFVPGSDSGTVLLVGTNAASGGFNDVIVLGNTTATSDGQLIADSTTYPDVSFSDLSIIGGSSFGLGSSTAGIFGQSSGALVEISTGGQNTLILDNSTTKQFVLGNIVSGGTVVSGIEFEDLNDTVQLTQNNYCFELYDNPAQLLTLGDADGKSGNGTQWYIDDANADIGSSQGTISLSNATGDVKLRSGGREFIEISNVSRVYSFGDLSSSFPNPGLINLNNGQFSYTRSGNRWIFSSEDVSNPVSGTVLIGDIDAGFNATIFTVDDVNGGIQLFQASNGFLLQPSASPKFTYGAIVFQLPTSNGTSGYILSTNGSGQTSWIPASSSGVTTIGTFDSGSPSADGAHITTTSLFMQSASTTNPGLVNIAGQTFNGLKGFQGGIIISPASGATGSVLLNVQNTGVPGFGASNNIQMYNNAGAFEMSFAINSHRWSLQQSFTADRAQTLPDAAGTFALTTAPGTTGTAPNWSAAGQLNIPLIGTTITSGTVSNGTQTFTGAKTFSSQTTLATPTTSLGSAVFPTGTAPTSPTTGAVWHSSALKAIQWFVAGVNQTVQTALFTSTATASVTNTTSETSLIGTGVGTKTLPANFFTAGKTVRLKVSGTISSAVAPGTLRIKAKYGTTVIGDTTAMTFSSSLTNQYFEVEFNVTCRTTGATGTVFGQGIFNYNTAVGTQNFWPLVNTATVTIDTTASNAIDISATWGTADANNIFTGTNSTIETIN